MTDYTALITAWNGATQPPTGVTGTALTGGMTTVQKLAAVNAWNVTGAVPTSFFVTGDQLLNCINYAEFKALAATDQNNILAICRTPGNLLGGSGNTAFIVDGIIIDKFPGAGPTIAALTALAKTTTRPWWQSNGYPRAFDLGDVAAAGLS